MAEVPTPKAKYATARNSTKKKFAVESENKILQEKVSIKNVWLNESMAKCLTAKKFRHRKIQQY